MTTGHTTVPSPCTSVCKMSPATGWCEGCFRTLDEIAAWGQMSDGAKRQVWKLLPKRRASVQAAVAPSDPARADTP